MQILKTNNINVFQRAYQYDPTRTLTLRRRFSGQMYNRFRRVKGLVRRAIVDKDGFGLQNPRTFQEPDFRQFDFRRSSDKVQAFMEWLKQMEAEEIFETIELGQIGQAVEAPWTNKYIQSAYQQGMIRAREEMYNKGWEPLDIDARGGIDADFNQPFHLDRVGLIYTRTYNELEGITDAMDQQISRILAQGLGEGKHPRELARLINDRVDKIGITRARTLARTETIRAHHSAMMQEYKNWGVVGVTVEAEFVTAGDDRVCPRCAELEGRVYPIREAEGLIPVHPNCRCITIPVDVTED